MQWVITSHGSEWPSLKSLQMINAGEINSYCWWEWKLVQPLWRTVWKFLKKPKIEILYDPATLFLCISKKDESSNSKSYIRLMFIAALFTIAKIWKQLKCLPKDDKYINIYIYCSNMDGPRDYLTKWSKSERERDTLWYSLLSGCKNICGFGPWILNHYN